MTDDIVLETIDEETISPARDAEIKQMLFEAFPDGVESFTETRHWHGSAPLYSVVGRRGGRMVGNVGIVVRDVACGGRIVRVAGIQNLGVVPPVRGANLGGALLAEAMDEARRRGIDFGLLFCVPQLERYYSSNGWRLIDVPVIMQYQGQTCPIPGKNITMACELTDELFPAGEIDLRGADW